MTRSAEYILYIQSVNWRKKSNNILAAISKRCAFCEGEDKFYSSVGEVESSAIDWINQYQSPSFVKANGAN